MPEKLWHLKNCDLFERLSPAELRQVESRCRSRVVPRRTPIYLPIDQADGVLLLTSGRAKICNFTAEGKQAILAFIEPGELFGELAIFSEGEREEYAEAVEKSTILLIPGEEIQRLMEQHPNISLGITKLIGLRRRRIERRLKYLLFRSNRERLIHLLLELTEQYGRTVAEGTWISIQLSHQDLANIIGSTRETVSLLLGEFQKEGILSIGRRKITLHDVTALALSVDARPIQPAQSPPFPISESPRL